jgi:hypothetical protein
VHGEELRDLNSLFTPHREVIKPRRIRRAENVACREKGKVCRILVEIPKEKAN